MGGKSVNRDLRIVTLGTVVHLPADYSHTYQFIGSRDHFGMMNSRWGVEKGFIPDKWHTLNSAIPGHLPVQEALRLAKVN